jgi:uncharacterized protein
MDTSTIFMLLAIGAIAGIASGFVGIGGGMIIVPALIYGLGLSQHMAQGTSLALMLPPIGLLAVASYYKAGQVNVSYAAWISVAFVLGAWAGSRWALRLTTSWVRLIFAGFLILAATKMAWKSIRELT